jgi:hypothetical protein
LLSSGHLESDSLATLYEDIGALRDSNDLGSILSLQNCLMLTTGFRIRSPKRHCLQKIVKLGVFPSFGTRPQFFAHLRQEFDKSFFVVDFVCCHRNPSLMGRLAQRASATTF